jgi:chemotaxis protein MotB
MAREPENLSELLEAAEESENRQWLVTYADMVTLLLTFFVMLLAISQVDNERFEDVMKSIQFTLGGDVAPGGKTGRIDIHQVQRKSLSQRSGAHDDPLLKDLQKTVKQKDIADQVEVLAHMGKIILRVKGQVLFDSGTADLKRQSYKVLQFIAKSVGDYPGYRLHVAGHTDNMPINSDRFKSNWELSALRATAVLRYLVSQGVNTHRLTATGYADTDPLAPNTSNANRARNRRVEFVMERANP